MAKAKVNAKNKMRKPNYHAMLFAAIIIVMYVLLMHSEITQYANILERREQTADLVRSSNDNSEKITLLYNQCRQSMEQLNCTSRFGAFLADNDKTGIGQIGNFAIVHGTRVTLLYMSIFIVHELFLQVKIIWRKLKYNPRHEVTQAELKNSPGQ